MRESPIYCIMMILKGYGETLRDYQRVKQTKYILPRTVYHQTIWRIRDYYRLKEMADDMIQRSINYDGMPKSNAPGDPVMKAVLRREKLIIEISCIDHALEIIPKEYRKGVWDNILHGSPYPMYADRSTYGRYKSKFIFLVAERMGLI